MMSNNDQSISKSLSQTCATENIEMFEKCVCIKISSIFLCFKKHHDMY